MRWPAGRSAIIGLLMVVVTVPAHLFAQTEPTLREGARVRVRAAPGAARQVGTVSRLTGDSVFVQSGRRMATVGYRRSEIDRLDVSEGQRRHRVRGLAIGASVGALVGALVPISDASEECESQDPQGCEIPGPIVDDIVDPIARAATLVTGAALGGAVGLAIGSRRVDRWITVSPTVGIRRSGRTGVEVSLRF